MSGLYWTGCRTNNNYWDMGFVDQRKHAHKIISDEERHQRLLKNTHCLQQRKYYECTERSYNLVIQALECIPQDEFYGKLLVPGKRAATRGCHPHKWDEVKRMQRESCLQNS
jgi:hypothetical protein